MKTMKLRTAPLFDRGRSFGSFGKTNDKGSFSAAEYALRSPAGIYMLLLMHSSLMKPEWDYSWYDPKRLEGFEDDIERMTGGCEDIAAISTPRAGEIYSLLAIAKDIEDSNCNETRFFLISATPQNNIVTDKALVICQMDGSRPGSLLAVLSEFAQRGINLTRIESRPAKTGLGAYIFFFDLEVPTISEGLTECLAAVKERSFWLKDLGRFPVIRN